MNDELQQIHRKLDLVLEELKKLQGSNPPSSATETFTIKQAAKKLSLSVARLYALIYEGKLKPLQREKYSRIQFNEQILNNYLDGNSKE